MDESMTAPAFSSTSRPSSRGADTDMSHLPDEVWQHIFTFLPPITLGRLMRVNRKFNALLTPESVSAVHGLQSKNSSSVPGVLRPIPASTIWSISRKAFHAGTPRSLAGCDELRMCKLIYGTGCQLCGKQPVANPSLPSLSETCNSSSSSSLFQSGPGSDGVRIIWPFGIRTCSECLLKNSEKEMELLFSSLPSFLVAGLAPAFFTADMNYISSVALRNLVTSPSAPPVELEKRFFKPHIEELKKKFENVKTLGLAAAEEWVKGLEANAKEKSADAARWETWEATGGLTKLLKWTSLIDAPQRTPSPSSVFDSSSASTRPTTSGHNLPPRPANPDKLRQSAAHHSPTTDTSHNKSTTPDVRAARKAEIEQRCLELDPPLTIDVLKHMHAFNAAIQFTTPFTDKDWEILKPRLFAQREAAEQKEAERLKQEEAARLKAEERREREAQAKEAKDKADSEWDAAQKPLKDKLLAYADAFIREGWKNGDAVTKKNCARFAAHALLHVRKRFYSDLADEDARLIHEGKPIVQDPPDAPPTRKIILENMKYVFDTKIKPLTEKFQKELFLCNGCDNNMKFFGFEGVIQHYAAKHTSELSLGSIVVHWRAEWPEKPPFHPDPDSAKALFKTMQQHNAMRYHGQVAPYARQPFGASTPYAYPSQSAASAAAPPPPPPPPPPYRNASPAAQSYYTQQVHYGPYTTGAPPTVSPPIGYSALPPQVTPSAGHVSPYPHSSYTHSPVLAKGYTAVPRGSGSNRHQKHGLPVLTAAAPVARTPDPHHARASGQSGSAAGLYQMQLDDMARNARSVWNCTSGVKDMPSNVRAHVLLHHVMETFERQYATELSLELFSEGVNSHPQMKPIKGLGGLVCKACNPIDGDGRHQVPSSYYGKGKPRLFTLPGLLAHFQKQHVERAIGASSSAAAAVNPTSKMDWRYDMLLLPDHATIAGLAEAPGMDDDKIRLVAAAFPQVFLPEEPMPEEQYYSTVPAPAVPTHHSHHHHHGHGHGYSHGHGHDSHHPYSAPMVDQVVSTQDGRHARAGEYRLVKDKPDRVASPRYMAMPVLGKRRSDAFRETDHASGGHGYANSPAREKRSRPDPRYAKTKSRSATNSESGQAQKATSKPHLLVQEDRIGPSPLRNVSEDGDQAEQGKVKKSKGSTPRPGSTKPPVVKDNEPLTAAERFLSTFNPEDEMERIPETTTTGAVAEEVGEAEHSAKHSTHGHKNNRSQDNRSARPNPRSGHAPVSQPEASDAQRPVHYSHNLRGRKEYADSRNQYSGHSHPASVRPRSQSPGAHGGMVVDPYYRERSPQGYVRRHRTYAMPAENRYYEAVPVEDVTYTSAPRGSRYQYVQDVSYAEPVYTEEAPEAVRYQYGAAAEPTYVMERPRQRKEYVELDYGQQGPASSLARPTPPPPPPPPPMDRASYYPATTHGGSGAPSRHSGYQ